jgi:glycopeptide antibiotics resistance protein
MASRRRVSNPNWPHAILMTDSWTAARREARIPSWSNRILIAAVVGIFFLTLYPFQFSLVRRGLPFLLNGWGKGSGAVDVFLNVLLFIPFGFGLAESLRERGRSRAAALGLALVAGAALSYTVELLQFFIPMRDSGWGDVVTNSTGSALGSLVYEFGGATILGFASHVESAFITWLNWRRVTLGFLLYVGMWLAVSIHFQREVRIIDWAPHSMLLIGSSAAEEPDSAWNGRVFEVEFWNRVLPETVAKAITSGGPQTGPPPLASYNLSGSPPFQDRRRILPDLAWVHDPSASAPPVAEASWLMSGAPISSLVNQIARTNRFSLHVLCQASPAVARNRRIVVIAQLPGSMNLVLDQKGTQLGFWFRNPLSAKRPRLAWDVPNVFAPDQVRNLLISYDGSRLALYVDGRKEGRPYELGPGAGLASLLHGIKSGELEGYHDIFYAIVFFPPGCLLGLGWRKLSSQSALRLALMLLGVLVVPFLFEICLSFAASASVWFGNMVLSMLLVLAGAFWINADHHRPESRKSAELA